ncbi:MAG: 50S ribosomal protein L28 [Rickettsiales bacterium]|jgi:large subunit ribosomal protein L28|nr:50S ribosomal protein L28 [Rickettsiales bacterium]
MAKSCELTGQKVVAGKNVSHTKGHTTRTSRDFIPNLKNVTLKSFVLDKNVALKIATGTLRTINKYGGFDNFIINYKKSKLTDKAKKIRKEVEKACVRKGLTNDENTVVKKKRIEKKIRPKPIRK